jgi:hypothetical protein
MSPLSITADLPFGSPRSTFELASPCATPGTSPIAGSATDVLDSGVVNRQAPVLASPGFTALTHVPGTPDPPALPRVVPAPSVPLQVTQNPALTALVTSESSALARSSTSLLRPEWIQSSRSNSPCPGYHGTVLFVLSDSIASPIPNLILRYNPNTGVAMEEDYFNWEATGDDMMAIIDTTLTRHKGFVTAKKPNYQNSKLHNPLNRNLWVNMKSDGKWILSTIGEVRRRKTKSTKSCWKVCEKCCRTDWWKGPRDDDHHPGPPPGSGLAM